MSIPKGVTTFRSQSAPPFIQIPESDLMEAFDLLSKSALKIYCLLAKNIDGYWSYLSPRGLEAEGIMSKSSASRAIKELQDVGYIDGDRFYVESKTKRAKRQKVKKEIESSL